MLETALDHFPNYQHLISNISLTLNGNSASGKVMCFNPMQTKDEQVFFLGMWYQDTYEKINDKFTLNIREFNEFVSNDKRVEQVIIPLGDGMTVCRVL